MKLELGIYTETTVRGPGEKGVEEVEPVIQVKLKKQRRTIVQGMLAWCLHRLGQGAKGTQKCSCYLRKRDNILAWSEGSILPIR